MSHKYEKLLLVRAALIVLALLLFTVNFFVGSEILQHVNAELGGIIHPLFVNGVLFFIAVITFIQFFLLRDITYIYYVNYILLNLLYFLIIFTNLPFVMKDFPLWLQDLRWEITLPILTLSYCFYILFAVQFMDMRNKSPEVWRWVKIFLKINFFLFFLSILIKILPLNNEWFFTIHNAILLCCMPIGLASILLVLFKIKNNIAKIIAFGSLFFFIGSVLGFILSFLQSYPVNHPPFNHWIFYTQTGALIEIVLFTSSFTYRTKFLEKEKSEAQKILIAEMEENQKKEQKLREIRNNIAQDLHDDIGATLSNLNILNELAKRNSQSEKSQEYLEKAQEDIQHVSESISDIVWNINPKFDKLNNLFIRMKRYASDMFESKKIAYQFHFPEDEKLIEHDFEYRKDLYLIFKEAVNNLIKYSEATEVLLNIEIEENILKMGIFDNGKGFNVNKISEGNGLQNMRNRAENIGADLQILSFVGEGTKILLIVPLSHYPNS